MVLVLFQTLHDSQIQLTDFIKQNSYGIESFCMTQQDLNYTTYFILYILKQYMFK
jgi:hypothetical protein